MIVVLLIYVAQKMLSDPSNNALLFKDPVDV